VGRASNLVPHRRGDDYAALVPDASGGCLRFLVEAISDAAGHPAGPPENVAVSHISDMPERAGAGALEIGCRATGSARRGSQEGS
jgi:hypothetical protein